MSGRLGPLVPCVLCECRTTVIRTSGAYRHRKCRDCKTTFYTEQSAVGELPAPRAVAVRAFNGRPPLSGEALRSAWARPLAALPVKATPDAVLKTGHGMYEISPGVRQYRMWGGPV